jgi:hypothetical protein
MHRYIAIILLCFSANIFAHDCTGEFNQSMAPTDTATLKWTYTTADEKIIRGETLLHVEHGSFSIIAGEHKNCMDTMTCSISEFACAISIALSEPSKNQLHIGRIQINSYGLYLKARKSALAFKDCSQAYSKYYLEIERFWVEQLLRHGSIYDVVKINPREIKLDKPLTLADKCFEATGKPPALWSGVDYFPVILVKKKTGYEAEE